jgi:5,10-methylenetetrahydromethanopterin reductase
VVSPPGQAEKTDERADGEHVVAVEFSPDVGELSQISFGTGSVAVAAALRISVTDDVAKVRSLAAQQFAMYGHLASYRAMLDREGFSSPEDAALIGDESTVWHQLDELRDAGVDEFVSIPYDPSPEAGQRTRACLRTWESR